MRDGVQISACIALALLASSKTTAVAAAAERVGRPQCAHAPPYPECTADYPRQRDYAVTVAERDPYHGRYLPDPLTLIQIYSYS